MKVSKYKALTLSRQGLLAKKTFGSGLSGTLKSIEQLGYIQIDTLSVVERAHHHVLWSRVSGYELTYLNQLVNEQKIFEYWYHAASYLPMRDYRYALPRMNSIRNGENRYYKNLDQKLMNEIIKRVEAEGPLRLRDFDNKKTGPGSWWNRGPGKRAMDALFMRGDLMVCERKGMEKVFDLTQRCLPEGIDISTPTLNEYASYLLNTTIRAQGVFTLKQLLHLETGKPIREAMNNALSQRIEAGTVTALPNLNSPSFYADSELLNEAPTVNPSAVQILSPFDNVLIHRDRLSALFKFDYKIECYVPAAKRVFGYFCLPILYGDQFVGRIDCKVHRAEQRFEVLSLHIEDNTCDQDKFFPALKKELQRFAQFNGCPLLDTQTNAIGGLNY
ncbi:MAG: YcaQ family DNA glycosylase [Pseudomonadales bacterium]|nr:YcaQ family DNA glycosylase [Pseudomonadales bacterium]